MMIDLLSKTRASWRLEFVLIVATIVALDAAMAAHGYKLAIAALDVSAVCLAVAAVRIHLHPLLWISLFMLIAPLSMAAVIWLPVTQYEGFGIAGYLYSLVVMLQRAKYRNQSAQDAKCTEIGS